jgi:hypothetical protein
MKKRRVMMADGRRYLIYYTFDKESELLMSDRKKSETQTAEGEMTTENDSDLNSSFIIPNSSIVPEERENV